MSMMEYPSVEELQNRINKLEIEIDALVRKHAKEVPALLDQETDDIIYLIGRCINDGDPDLKQVSELKHYQSMYDDLEVIYQKEFNGNLIDKKQYKVLSKLISKRYEPNLKRIIKETVKRSQSKNKEN